MTKHTIDHIVTHSKYLHEQYQSGGVENRLSKDEISKLESNLGGAEQLSSRLKHFESIQSESTSAETWVDILQEVIDNLPFDSLEDDVFNSQMPIPYEHFFLPFLRVARKKLLSKLDTMQITLDASALRSLERELIGKLSWAGSRCIHVEFQLFKHQVGNHVSSKVYEKTAHVYSRFIERCLNNDFLNILSQYSALARLLATITRNWIDSKVLFFSRFENDLEDLISRFDLATAISSITVNLSDPHNGGQQVYILETREGKRLVYKPRSLTVELLFNRFLQWFNSFTELPLKTLAILDKDDYGWIEFVDHTPCQTKEEIERYFIRSGMLLAIINVLSGSDYHNENLIANGEQPVPIDCEVMFEPRFPIATNLGNNAATTLALEIFHASVVSTGLLPVWRELRNNIADDASALGRNAGETKALYPKWFYINTDQMYLKDSSEPETLTTKGSTVIHKEHVVEAADYAPHIELGFDIAYRLILKNRHELLQDTQILTDFARCEMRYVFRVTRFYYAILYTSCSPRNCRSGIARSIHLELLARGIIVGSQQLENLWNLLQFEIEALVDGDIPKFTHFPNSTSLYCNGELVTRELFERSGLEIVLQRLQEMGVADLELQLKFLETSLSVAKVAQVHQSGETKSGFGSEQPKLLTSVEAVQRCKKFAKTLEHKAIESENSVTWLEINYIPRLEKYGIHPIGIDLYSGLSGIALFYAALYKITHEREYQSYARRILQPIRDRLSSQDAANQLLVHHDIGGATGIASIVYALTKISQLTDLDYIDDAFKASYLISSTAIDKDHRFDVLGGCGGAILGLLPLYEVTGDRSILETCIDCGMHLIEHQHDSKGWIRYSQSEILAGFSHGNSGIAYALLRLWKLTESEIFYNAAVRSLSYEDSMFDLNEGNWPDKRSPDLTFSSSWCHGAPGILLARLGIYKLCPTLLDTDVTQRSLVSTVQSVHNGPDHVCCGTMGKLETLFHYAELFGQGDLKDTVLESIGQIVHISEEYGGFNYHSKLPRGTFIPGFFIGLSGIGYQMLRLYFPEELPSVLLWE